MLAVEDDSDRLLRSVTQEVLTVCKAASVVLLLPRPAISFKRHATEARTDVLRSGRATADDDELIKLAGVIGVTPERVHPDKMEKHAIHNDVRNTPDLAWISGWMDHVVGLPLVCDGRWLGAMLAINRTVDEDFSSVEVKFLRAVADRITTFLESQRLYDDLADLFMGMLHALVSSIDAKDPYTCGHSTRVAVIGRRIAQQAGMSPAECQRVYLSGLLHDVGKIGVPDDILCKPGRLTNEEFDKLRGHPEIGAKILGHIRQVEDLIPGVLYHHERFDGRGYPRKLAGDNIPVLGRILCVADGFDAMTSTRTYRAALPVKVALAEVRRCAGTQFDPYFAELFLQNDADELLALAHERSGTQLGGGVATGIADPWEAAVQAFGEESLGAIIKSWQRLARSAPA
jgi:HD-GYP domain-containing protein (c-di-GMP phosphodiesterase class II)